MDYLEWAKDYFKNDRFAKAAGIIIKEVNDDSAVCVMDVKDMHLNAANTVMGGAVFTLADFTFGIASNAGQPPTVTLSGNISFMSVCKGKQLIASAVCEKSGRGSCFYTVHVDDELGNKVAVVNFVGFRKVKR